MDVKSQLLDAQAEHVLEASKGTPKVGRLVFATDSGILHVGDGSAWRQIGPTLGDIKASMLADGVFQTINGSGWIIADGRDVTGSDYHALTGNSTVPDMRGMFLRGKNNGRTDGNENPDGDLALGTYQADEFKSHTHGYIFAPNTGHADLNFYGGTRENDYTRQTDATGGDETRARNITVNYFIKIYK